MSAPNDAALRAALATLAEVLAPLVAAEVVRQLRSAEQPGFVDQHKSALGSRKHCALARTLIAEGSRDAAHVGRRWLVRVERIEAHAAEITRKRPKRAKPAPANDLSQVLETYGFEKASGE